MKKPTISEIAAYCTSRNNNIDAETFWHHYESNGWKVGKSLMSNWESAVITWEKRNPKPKEINRPPKQDKPPKPVKHMYNSDGSRMSFREVLVATGGGSSKALKIYDEMQEKKKRKEIARRLLADIKKRKEKK